MKVIRVGIIFAVMKAFESFLSLSMISDEIQVKSFDNEAVTSS